KGKLVKQYSTEFASLFEERLDHMVERRMRQSIFAVASCWYTAWVNAGQPQLEFQVSDTIPISEKREYERLNLDWKNNTIIGRDCL
ncbi:MAG TPA: S1/P1 Nuclease, partial [Puia sp.]|nr:S1/P1 Nuclease [Puia sp.]